MAAQVTDPQAEPGYDIHETRIPFITGVMATLVALMTMSVAARLYARAMLRRVLGWDDWFMLLAWVFVLGTNIGIWCLIPYGLGRHDSVSISNLLKVYEPYAKGTWALRILSIISGTLTRVAVCLGYMRLFPNRSSNTWFCRVAIFCCAVIGISLTLTNIFQCHPIAVFWKFSELKNRYSKCNSDLPWNTADRITTAVTNLAVFLWPAHLLWRLKLQKRQRISLIALFCAGCCISIISILRMWNWFGVSMAVTVYSETWGWGYFYLLMAVELNFGIICGCLPFCKPALVAVCPCLFRRKFNKAAAAEPPMLPKFHAFTSPAALRRKKRDSFSDVQQIMTRPIMAMPTHQETAWPPAVAPRVVQNPPQVDFRALKTYAG